MKIIFIHPDQIGNDSLHSYRKIAESKRKRQRSFPLGMFLLMVNMTHAFCFIDNCIHRLSNGQLVKYCLEKIGKEKAVIAFGGTFLEWPQAFLVSQLIKEKRPDIITVYGGPNATARPEKHQKFFDYVFIGNAVSSFPKFIQALEQNTDLPDKGIYGRGQPIYKIPSSIIWPTLQNIARKKLENKPYPNNIVFSAVGCPFSCRFCAAKYIWNRNVFFRNETEVIDEIKFLKSIGVKRIQFREDNFTINRKRLLSFCEQLKRLSINWLCQARVSSLDEETIKIMKGSGCSQISCGFESINDNTLNYIDKGHTAQDIENVIRWCQKYKLEYTGGFIAGFPNETKQDILNTVKFTKFLSKQPYSSIPKMPVQFLGIPVSELYYEVLEKNLVAYDWYDGELLFCNTLYVSCEEIESLIKP